MRILEFLILPVNTLPYLHALLAHINNSQGKSVNTAPNRALLPGGRLWEPMLKFMENFDPVQIRYSGPEFEQLVKALEFTARKSSMVGSNRMMRGLGGFSANTLQSLR